MHIRKRAIAVLLTVLLAAAAMCGTAGRAYAAEEPEGYIVMSVEKLTLGQGFILEPRRIPYYKGERLSQVLTRTLEELGRDYEMTGTLTSGFYLASVQDPGRPSVENTMPDYIKEMYEKLASVASGTPPLSYTDTVDPDYLGQYDYSPQSGWMYTVGGTTPPVGAADVAAADGQVVRWQFTVVGYGGDLGAAATTPAGSHELMSRNELYTVLAAVGADENLMADKPTREAYDAAMSLCADITLTKETVQPYLDTLKRALGGNQISELSLPSTESGVRTCAYGTEAETLQSGMPEYLLAVIDDTIRIITGVTWTTDSKFGVPGTYQFRPVLPEKYGSFKLTAELPVISVTMLPPDGDVTGDGLRDVRDVSRMASSAGKTDRPLCDLDGSGTVSWNDFRLLLGQLGEDALDTAGGPDTGLGVVFDKAEYRAGETAAATICVTGAVFDAYSVRLAYDTQALELRTVQQEDAFLETAAAETEDGLWFGGATLEGAKQSDVVATVLFTALADGPAEAAVVPEDTALLAGGYYLNVAADMALYAAPEQAVWGDVNGDGTLGEDDITTVIEYYRGAAQLTEEQVRLADVDGDGEAGFYDIVLMIRRYNGWIDTFPVEKIWSNTGYQEENT